MINTVKTNVMNLKSKVSLFTLLILISIGLCILGYIHNTGKFRESQQQIIRTYEKSLTHYDQTYIKKRSLQLQEVIEKNQKHQEEIKALLELEFNKIQNEYETQEIWTGILTIVFLIFSFYSLFKSEELENKGEEALTKISSIKEQAQTACDGIESEKIKKINSVQTQYEAWKQEREAEISLHISESNKTQIKDLKQIYSNIISQMTDEVRFSCNQQLQEMLNRGNAEIQSALKRIEETNSNEIRRQISMWNERFLQQKEEFSRQFNETIESFTEISEEEMNEMFKDVYGKEMNQMVEEEIKQQDEIVNTTPSVQDETEEEEEADIK